MVIRRLEASELPSCAPLAHHFYAEGGIPGAFISEVFEASWRSIFDAGVGRIYGAWQDGNLVGVLGCALVPDINDGELVANETFWFVLPEARDGVGLRLLRHYIEEMRAAGAARMTMVHLQGRGSDRLRRLYSRLGFRPLETHYVADVVSLERRRATPRLHDEQGAGTMTKRNAAGVA